MKNFGSVSYLKTKRLESVRRPASGTNFSVFWRSRVQFPDADVASSRLNWRARSTGLVGRLQSLYF